MLKELSDILKEFAGRLFRSRLFPVAAIFTVMFAVLVVRLFQLQILEAESHQSDYTQMSLTTVSTGAVRGNIYDRNGVLLAYDQLVYSVTLKDIGYYEKNAEKNEMILQLIHLLDECGEAINMSIPIEVAMNADGEYAYTTDDKNRKRQFLRDIYGINLSQLDDASGKYPSDITADQAIEIMKKNYYFDKWLDENGDQKVLNSIDQLLVCNIRYMLSQYLYRKYISVKIATNIKDTTMSTILEHTSDLKGVDVEEDHIRVYPDGEYFSHIIGYTGLANPDELAQLQKTDPTYSSGDYVGKSGIESLLEFELSGTKGQKTMYLDSTGKVIEVISEDKALIGNDVYLTIDHDLTIACYKLLERQLADTILIHLVNKDSEMVDPDTIYISIKDVYYHLFYNNVLSFSQMSESDAPEWEKRIYDTVDKYKNDVLSVMKRELHSSSPAQVELLDPILKNSFMYAFGYLCSSGYVFSDKLNTSKDKYIAMSEGKISLREFIYSLISEADVINVSKLIESGSFYDGDVIFDSLCDRLLEELYNDGGFSEIFIHDLIDHYGLKTSDICLSLYSQNILKEDYEVMEKLKEANDDECYNFIYSCIKNIQITPAQLALDPCNGSVIITDVNNGDVLALVSYPSYDNNMFSGSVNSEYYQKLLADKSYPLINYATQARSAPGSTFKIITAIAGLEEKLTNTSRLIDCTGIFDLVSPPARCSIYTSTGSGHGELDLVQAIAASCNYYFYTLGYEMSLDENGEYIPELGIEKLAKYAAKLGFGEKSGLELGEYAPQISTEYPVPSAIGQGTNNFTPSQMSRYVTAVASSGYLYQLTLLDRVCDNSGVTVKTFENTKEKVEGIKGSTWKAVKEGMYEVTHSGTVSGSFIYTGLDVAAKTGTAQEDLTRPDHAVFISYSPTDKPQITLTCTMRFGYSSGHLAPLAANIYSYYFGRISLDDILKGKV